MVHYQRYNPLKKGIEVVPDDEESQNIVDFRKITRPRFLYLLFLSLFSCSLILTPQFFSLPSNFSLLYSFGYEDFKLSDEMDVNTPICSSISNGTICCDRSSIRSDICMMKGDVRTHSLSSSIYLYTSRNSNGLMDYVPGPNDGEEEENKEEEIQHEKIRPYTRKWEQNTVDSVNELQLISKRENSGAQHQCDVKHDVPAIFFSTSGHTGNIFHEFNDGILPLYITSQHFKKKVVFVISEYHNWWISKYGDILSRLSDYPPIDFSGDNRTHCFPEAIVGLRIHDDLTVDPSLMEGGKSIKDFRNLLDRAYRPRVKGIIMEEEREARLNSKGKRPSPQSSEHEVKRKQKWDLIKKPKLAILSRNDSRAITNEDLLVKMGEEIGFEVEVLRPGRTTELARVYRTLNSSDVFVGVHGAAVVHLLFLRPGSVFIQVIPLGTDWAAETYYGEPSTKLGLKYIGYKILPKESSLYYTYKKDDPVLNDPDSVHKKGWEFTKKIYLDHQDVTLNLERFRKRLVRAYNYSVAKKNRHAQSE